jgi:hypothetical protein
MPDINFDWVRQQMTDAKVKVGTGNALLALLETWNKQKLTNNQIEEAVEYFSKLALGINIYEEKLEDEIWIPAQPGQLTVGDQVRVLADAFSDPNLVSHNGRRGVIVAIRYGDIIFKSTDGKNPILEGVHYSPYKLEKRIK